MLLSARRREILRGRVRQLLNRPDEDDLFRWPDEYNAALDDASRYYRRHLAEHAPNLVYQKEVIEPEAGSGGRVYPLPGTSLGHLEVWAPPGPPRGSRLYPSLPENRSRGRFYLEGENIMLIQAKVYSPGLHVRWVPYEPDDESPELPGYLDQAITLRAAYEMARKPGYMGDPEHFRARARNEWLGDPEDPSDGGIIGVVKRQAEDYGFTQLGHTGGGWWEGITSDV